MNKTNWNKINPPLAKNLLTETSQILSIDNYIFYRAYEMLNIKLL